MFCRCMHWVGSITLQFDWLWFSIVVIVAMRNFLSEGRDYTCVQIGGQMFTDWDHAGLVALYSPITMFSLVLALHPQTNSCGAYKHINMFSRHPSVSTCYRVLLDGIPQPLNFSSPGLPFPQLFFPIHPGHFGYKVLCGPSGFLANIPASSLIPSPTTLPNPVCWSC